MKRKLKLSKAERILKRGNPNVLDLYGDCLQRDDVHGDEKSKRNMIEGNCIKDKEHVIEKSTDKAAEHAIEKSTEHAIEKEIKFLTEIERSPMEIHPLLPGTVLLKNFLLPTEQQHIVDICRDLGKGEGGFYRPVYASGANCKLHMMCLGKHWNLITGKYETTRSNYDNAPVIPLPETFHGLVDKALEKAVEIDPLVLGQCSSPKMDVCVVNYYAKAGRNGLHTDKDESEESIQKGSPVVSFSVGCSADFAYTLSMPPKRSKEEVPVVKLESGDVLIFGGPSRLLVHSLTRVYPNTAPSWLKMRPGRLNLTFRQY